MNMEVVQQVAEAVRHAKSVVVLTGAGISAESGIPTFRDAMDGYWVKFDPNDLATPEAFARDPETVSRWYDERRLKCATVKPNAGHFALAELQRQLKARGRKFTLVTQNVDRLHQAAGSTDVIELHGSIVEWHCVRCGQSQEERGGAFKEYPPKCLCGGNRRPSVIWFGEMLPEDAVMKAWQAAQSCNLFFSVGTSAVVYPAAGLASDAQHAGAKIVEINPTPTPLSSSANWVLAEKAGVALPLLIAKAFDGE